MEAKTKLIYVYIYDPAWSSYSKKSDCAVCTTIHCSKTEECGLYKRKECFLLSSGGLFRDSTCPHGKKEKCYGHTRRAKNYRSWIERMEKTFKITNQVGPCNTKMAEVGDYIILPYSFFEADKLFEADKCIYSSNNKFLDKSKWNVETVKKILNFKPQALFCGEITDYQREDVPRIIMHLKEVFPEMFDRVCKEIPELEDRVKELSNIGRKAILITTATDSKPFIDCHGASWAWDGSYLTSKDSRSSFMPIDSFSEVRIKPKEECVIEINDDSQVGTKTVFKD